MTSKNTLEAKMELREWLQIARDALLDAMELIPEDDYCRLERLAAGVGKIAGEYELIYLRALEEKCKKLEDFE